MKGIKFISLANKPYFDFLEGCIKSCLYYYPEFSFDAYLVNASKKDINKFNNINKKVNIYNIIKKVKHNKKKIRNIKIRHFCGNYRNTLLKKYIDFNGVISWIDADSLFLRRSNKWKNLILVNDYDIIAYKGKKTILSGIITCNNTKNAKKFIQNYANFYDPNESHSKIRKRFKTSAWMLDQNAYKKVLKNMKKEESLEVKIIKKPMYISKVKVKKEIKDSVIWLPIREKKKKLFKKELKKYLKLNLN